MASGDVARRGSRRRPWLENPALPLWFLILDIVLVVAAFLLLHVSLGVALVLHFAIFSVLTFLLFGWDKWRAKRQGRRVSEMNLILFTLFGGGLGGLFGMLSWRHKGRHLLFRILVPAAAFVQLSISVVALVKKDL